MRVLWIGAIGMVVGMIALAGAGGRASAATVPLQRGCNEVTLTFPTGTAAATVAAAVTPPQSLLAIWRLDASGRQGDGYSPQAPAVSDLQTVTTGERVSVCVTGPATLTQPDAPPVPTATPTPTYRTLLALRANQLTDRGRYPFTLSRANAARLCATQVGDPGPGLLAVTVLNPQGTVVFQQNITATGCTPLNLPAGGYTINAVQASGLFTLQVQEQQ